MNAKPRPLRALPSVESLLSRPALAGALSRWPRLLVVEAVRGELAAERDRMRRSGGLPESPEALIARVERRAGRAAEAALRRVLNATGVVLHTNLGRAPLAGVACEAVARVAGGYSSLEFDLDSGRRGERGLGVERWLTRLTGAEAALAVNNGAGALLLAVAALAAGRAVVVSRGELVEIGGSFRIPEIIGRSGARLLEIGTTNRTHLRDYQRALERDDVGAVLRVHRSNFRIEGFTTRPGPAEIAALARKRRVPFIEDLGSGALVDLAAFGLEHEPTVGESLKAGVDVVTFSGDKLLGGAQAGLVVGGRKWIERARKDPLARALRLDKLALAALEATLPLYADPARAARELPVIAMLAAAPEVLEARAGRLARALAAAIPGLVTRVARGKGEVGGGALPLRELPGWVVEVRHPRHEADALQRRARAGDPPVIATVRAGAVRLDPRTLTESELDEVVEALARAWRGEA